MGRSEIRSFGYALCLVVSLGMVPYHKQGVEVGRENERVRNSLLMTLEGKLVSTNCKLRLNNRELELYIPENYARNSGDSRYDGPFIENVVIDGEATIGIRLKREEETIYERGTASIHCERQP